MLKLGQTISNLVPLQNCYLYFVQELRPAEANHSTNGSRSGGYSVRRRSLGVSDGAGADLYVGEGAVRAARTRGLGGPARAEMGN